MNPATTKQNSYKAKRLVAQKDIMLLGFVASLFSISVGISFLGQRLKASDYISSLIIIHLQDLISKKPNNALARLLYNNRFYIVENIRQHYIFDKASFYFGLCIFVTAFCCISIITHRTYINRYSKNTSKHKNNSSEPSDLKFQAAIFGCVFFSTTGLITASLLIPFAVKIPSSLSELLCAGVDQIEHKNNPLVEVLKSMINHTFKDEKVVTEIKYNVSVKLVILFSICASLSFLFIALSFVYCMDKPAEDKRNGQDLANTKRKNAGDPVVLNSANVLAHNIPYPHSSNN